MTITFFFILVNSISNWIGLNQSMTNTDSTGSLTVYFENLEKTGGTIRLALYTSPEHFMVEEKAILHNFKIVKPGKMEVALPNLPYGTYAFAVFQDENENNKLDTNLLGVPTEPYAFSKIPPSKWRVPKFEEVKFDIQQPSQKLTVRLEKWKL